MFTSIRVIALRLNSMSNLKFLKTSLESTSICNLLFYIETIEVRHQSKFPSMTMYEISKNDSIFPTNLRWSLCRRLYHAFLLLFSLSGIRDG